MAGSDRARLSEAQRQELGERLRAEYARLRAEIEEERHDASPEMLGSRTDEPRESSAESVVEGLRDVAGALLGMHVGEAADLRAAIERMEDGSYGECVDCGEVIGYERLLAHPAAARCVGCQGRREAAR
ncbi:MAG: TraR/DksA C4-type zinc finger protein [Ectothiorhodospiraceae bacterium]|nr:TraR/DksA C4-type zinc finger protein [Chromatiales bacterium]MCP5153770.1 TraR/DksA C4-type zinc finger protein [Ectothiorhodospiraceae bacterium]